MAHLTKTYKSDIDMTVFSVNGQVTFEEIWEQTHILLIDKPSRLVLWDFTIGTVASVSSEETSRIAEQGSQLLSKVKEGKAAILAPKDIDFGMSRMFQAFSDIKVFPYKIEVFRDMYSALEWLKRDH